jgi:hypothetical protein
VRYSFVAQSRSNLKMIASLDQSGYEPGADLRLRAALTEYDLPLAQRARVRVELTRPGGSYGLDFRLSRTIRGSLRTTTQALTAGIYLARFMAQGVTLRGMAVHARTFRPLSRVWRGGDNPYQPPGGGMTATAGAVLLSCVLAKRR